MILLIIRFTRLSLWYGESGVALSWFKSYLSGERVKIGDCLSLSINIFIWPNRSYLIIIIISRLLHISLYTHAMYDSLFIKCTLHMLSEEGRCK